MEFMNRSGAQPSAARVTPNGGGSSAASSSGGGRREAKSPKWLRVLWVVLLFAITVLTISVALLIYFGGNKESDYIDSKKQQAVFLANGQVYFGEVKSITDQYLDLHNIYYLNVNQQVQPNQKDQQQAANVTLVKLGCELHGPVDQMIINREQVTFWENLKTDGQVTKAIAEWVKQNPNGQQCSQATNTTTESKP